MFGSYRPHVALFELPGFGGVHEGSPDRPHGQTVAAVLSASEMLSEEHNKRSIIIAGNFRFG